MATPEKLPAEENVSRPTGRQMTAREARDHAAEHGTADGVAPVQGSSGEREVSDRAFDARLGVSGTADGSRNRGASGGSHNAQPGEPAPDEAPFAFAETALGGADTIQKTTWGVGHGTEPRGAEYAPVGLRKGEGEVVARTATGGGLSPVAWVIGLIAALVAAVYGFNLFTG